MSPLSNVEAGIGDAGMAAALINNTPTLKLSKLAFMVVDIALMGSGSTINRCHQFLVRLLSAPFAPANDHRLATHWQ